MLLHKASFSIRVFLSGVALKQRNPCSLYTKTGTLFSVYNKNAGSLIKKPALIKQHHLTDCKPAPSKLNKAETKDEEKEPKT
jgi:hypothetical protein